ncbi:PEP-CTERM sorting domain-containing protein [bacterium]|nr:PEP-CTERM sorting domain-containing protein [bacterium]
MRTEARFPLHGYTLLRISGLVACIGALVLLLAASGWSSHGENRGPSFFSCFNNEGFSVPEPSSTLFLTAAAVAALRQRKRE